MDRDYMIRREEDGTIYCSRCGKRQLDRYNMKKHAAFSALTGGSSLSWWKGGLWATAWKQKRAPLS